VVYKHYILTNYKFLHIGKGRETGGRMKKTIVILFIIILILGITNNIALANSDDILSKKITLEKYYTYEELTALLGQLKGEYPDIFNYSSLGETWEGRDIWLVKISDNVDVNEEEAEIFLTGGMHGDEKQGYETVIYTIKAFVENYTYPIINQSFTERVRNVINNTEIYIVPMLNPDGVVARTRKNARPNNCLFGGKIFKGVDIGRNSGYNWEVHDKHPIRYAWSFPYNMWERVNVRFPIIDTHSLRGEGCYRGPEPFSEPESKALKYVVENNNISIYVDHHSGIVGGVIIYGYASDHDFPIPKRTLMSSIAQGMQNITDYSIKQGSVIRIFGNMRDWMLAEHGVLAFCFELPKTIGDKRLLHIIHENGAIKLENNVPVLEICKTHVLANLYIAERAMELS